MNKSDAALIISVANGEGTRERISLTITQGIERFYREKEIKIVGKIVYGETITKAMVAGVSVAAYKVEPSGEAAEEIIRMWDRIEHLLQVSS